MGSDDDVVIIPIHLLIYIYVYLFTQRFSLKVGHKYALDCVFLKSHSKVNYESLGRHQ